jgi:hypothetical protein
MQDAAAHDTAEHLTLSAWAQFALSGGTASTPAPTHRSPAWLTDLRPLELIALLGALAFVARAFLTH